MNKIKVDKILLYVWAVTSCIFVGIIVMLHPHLFGGVIVANVIVCFNITINFAMALCYSNRFERVRRLLLLISATIAVGAIAYYALYTNNLLQIFISVNSFRDFILSTGSIGMLVYVIIEYIQVVLIPIPTILLTLAAVAIFGPLIAAILCTIAVLLASYTAFILGRRYGTKILTWAAGKEASEKYRKILNNRGPLFLTIAFILPLFPDDILCLTAGMTDMKFKQFFWISTLTRPISIFGICFFGSGSIIPFSGWGLYVWGMLLLLCILAFIFFPKIQARVEKLLEKMLKKNKQT